MDAKNLFSGSKDCYVPGMSRWKHWTPSYAVGRIRLEVHQRLHPDDPWLTPEATSLLDRLLRPTDIAIEWGSGRSTAWIARRVKHLTSFEDQAEWYARVKESLERQGIQNVTYNFVDLPVTVRHDANTEYARGWEKFPDESIDFALIDGQARLPTALGVLPKLRPGGLLVVDNAEWYLERPPRPGEPPIPEDPTWQEFALEVRDWRVLWCKLTFETAIWIKTGKSQQS